MSNLLSLQLYGIILIKFYRRKRMIREAKRKHGRTISSRGCKKLDASPNLPRKLPAEYQQQHPCIQLGMQVLNTFPYIRASNIISIKL